jgi:cytochrome c556
LKDAVYYQTAFRGIMAGNDSTTRKGGMMKIQTKIIVLVVVGIMMTGVAVAQFAKSEDAIRYRKATMVLIAHHFKQMGAVVQGKADYDQKIFAANAEVVKTLATLPWDAFLEPGTDKGDTTMSAAVFKKKNDFLKMAEAFQKDTALLAEAAQGADLNGVKAPFNTVAQNCKACHKPFRK